MLNVESLLLLQFPHTSVSASPLGTLRQSTQLELSPPQTLQESWKKLIARPEAPPVQLPHLEYNRGHTLEIHTECFESFFLGLVGGFDFARVAVARGINLMLISFY